MDDLSTEEEINEWTKRSRKEGICGIVNYFNRPTKQCKKCTNYYCKEHFPSHLDLVPDYGLENPNSNAGLDNFVEESEEISNNGSFDRYLD
jgi:hypothetical protein